jgi:hypothetical protein
MAGPPENPADVNHQQSPVKTDLPKAGWPASYGAPGQAPGTPLAGVQTARASPELP